MMKSFMGWFSVGSCALLLIAQAASAELVVYLPLDEGQGEAASDESGNGNMVEFRAAPEWVDGRFGKALKFEGQKWITVEVDDADIFINPFTVSTWINAPLAGNTWQQVVRCGPHDGSGRYSWFVNNGGFMSWRGFGAPGWQAWSTMPGGSISADEWTHIAIVNTGEDLINYVNGEMVNSEAFQLGNGNTAYIGLGWDGTQGGENYDGSVDDFAVFNSALGADEIAGLAADTVGGALSVDPSGKAASAWGRLKRQ